ncbi:uncharacterized protein C8Q71DRAFT_260913 [Rhodofomes roseus]|uniref:Uncharacterized protein n=1 Tax=Rhodofomes roseus TaxID=34475 RepID=A0ABQ8K6D1_9APHY|nr:uncharacterized protein C8Q71DRAFT_260913 [Rhodofomes roseus]KAH9832612.1 hypothetical protein C8Q71DRAFT_260913 [Rhodofomes roseus]
MVAVMPYWPGIHSVSLTLLVLRLPDMTMPPRLSKLSQLSEEPPPPYTEEDPLQRRHAAHTNLHISEVSEHTANSSSLAVGLVTSELAGLDLDPPQVHVIDERGPGLPGDNDYVVSIASDTHYSASEHGSRVETSQQIRRNSSRISVQSSLLSRSEASTSHLEPGQYRHGGPDSPSWSPAEYTQPVEPQLGMSTSPRLYPQRYWHLENGPSLAPSYHFSNQHSKYKIGSRVIS